MFCSWSICPCTVETPGVAIFCHMSQSRWSRQWYFECLTATSHYFQQCYLVHQNPMILSKYVQRYCENLVMLNMNLIIIFFNSMGWITSHVWTDKYVLSTSLTHIFIGISATLINAHKGHKTLLINVRKICQFHLTLPEYFADAIIMPKQRIYIYITSRHIYQVSRNIFCIPSLRRTRFITNSLWYFSTKFKKNCRKCYEKWSQVPITLTS